MDFSQSVQTCIAKYAHFEGRASRPEFWWFALFVVVIGLLLHIASHLLAALFHVAMLVPLFAAGARRLHDTDRSGWWQLITLVPFVGWIVLLVLFAQPGSPGDNAYGGLPPDTSVA
jgi:uncharacterized membrane protein YhaH (DUF805 family)